MGQKAFKVKLYGGEMSNRKISLNSRIILGTIFTFSGMVLFVLGIIAGK